MDDLVLRRNVEAELEWDPSIDARRIGVSAKDGIVTLTGMVSSFAEKWNAERAVERVAGVAGIANELEVNVIGDRSDEDLARTAVNALLYSTNVPPDSVKVKVDDGWITLKGEVGYGFQRVAAERAVRYLPGVRGISNLIKVKPKVEPKGIKSKIEEAFRRQADVDAERISVQVNGREVILRGSVGSWAEREAAERAAWAAPGVRRVINDLTVRAAA